MVDKAEGVASCLCKPPLREVQQDPASAMPPAEAHRGSPCDVDDAQAVLDALPSLRGEDGPDDQGLHEDSTALDGVFVRKLAMMQKAAAVGGRRMLCKQKPPEQSHKQDGIARPHIEAMVEQMCKDKLVPALGERCVYHYRIQGKTC